MVWIILKNNKILRVLSESVPVATRYWVKMNSITWSDHLIIIVHFGGLKHLMRKNQLYIIWIFSFAAFLLKLTQQFLNITVNPRFILHCDGWPTVSAVVGSPATFGDHWIVIAVTEQGILDHTIFCVWYQYS